MKPSIFLLEIVLTAIPLLYLERDDKSMQYNAKSPCSIVVPACLVLSCVNYY